MPKSSQTKIRSSDHEITHQQHEIDSPVISVQQLERLHEFRPELVDWVLEQTKIEAEHRRAENRRTNTFVFIENILGRIFASILGIAGVGFGTFVISQEKIWAGGSIIVITLMLVLAAAFFKGRK